MNKIIYAGHLPVQGWYHKACEVLEGGGICTCINTQSNNLLQKILIKDINQLKNKMVAQINKKTGKAEYFGIRKPTPRECFRLMDVSDEDFDKLLATDEKGKRLISNSALYRLAGNSIVENCLSLIYRQIWSA